MNRFAVSTPEGMRDRLYGECRDRVAVDEKLASFFGRRGYARVLTPTAEFYDVFLRSGNIMPQEEMVKLVEGSGRILVLRPDMTTPIARIAGTRLGGEVLPQRFYYVAPVYRLDSENMGRSFEITQAGVELLGAGGLRADLEVISLAVDALFACGFQEFYFGLGHAGVFRALVEELHADEETLEELRRLVASENYAALDDLLESFQEKDACAAIRALPTLFGGEEVLDEAEAMLRAFPRAIEPLRYLRELVEALKQAGYGEKIKVDLSLMNQIDYYTGILFHGYVDGAGSAVLTGGRYDDLIGAFGREMPATGFAIDTDTVAACLPGVPREPTEELLWFSPGTMPQALGYMESRPEGRCALSTEETLEKSLALAAKKGIPTVVCFEDAVRRMEVEL